MTGDSALCEDEGPALQDGVEWEERVRSAALQQNGGNRGGSQIAEVAVQKPPLVECGPFQCGCALFRDVERGEGASRCCDGY